MFNLIYLQSNTMFCSSNFNPLTVDKYSYICVWGGGQ